MIIKFNNTIINHYYIQRRTAFFILVLEKGLAFSSREGTHLHKHRYEYQASGIIALPWLKKFPSPPLVLSAPQHLFPIASASQYGHYYLQTYFKIAC